MPVKSSASLAHHVSRKFGSGPMGPARVRQQQTSMHHNKCVSLLHKTKLVNKHEEAGAVAVQTQLQCAALAWSCWCFAQSSILPSLSWHSAAGQLRLSEDRQSVRKRISFYLCEPRISATAWGQQTVHAPKTVMKTPARIRLLLSCHYVATAFSRLQPSLLAQHGSLNKHAVAQIPSIHHLPCAAIWNRTNRKLPDPASHTAHLHVLAR